ncbi:MAG: DNA polymerase III subunit delta [Elusimicrobia bacterium]|nr:DNA polymerase III subunit delta [Elusimicrobiota bacterium]
MPTLKPAQLFSRLQQKKLALSYFFCGQERFLIGQAAKKIQQALGLDKKSDADSFSIHSFRASQQKAQEVVEAALSPSLLGGCTLLLAEEVQRWSAADKKLLAHYLEDPSPTTHLVLISEEPKADLRDPVAAAVAALGELVIFWPLSDSEARSWIRETFCAGKKRPSASAVELLLKECGTDLGTLDQEIEKLALYLGNRAEVQAQDVWASLGTSREVSLYDFIRTLQAQEAPRALQQLTQLTQGQLEPVRILSSAIFPAIQKQLKAKLWLQQKMDREEIFKRLRLHKIYDRSFFDHLKKQDVDRLKKSLTLCLQTDVKLKTGEGTHSALHLLQELILQICGRIKWN